MNFKKIIPLFAIAFYASILTMVLAKSPPYYIKDPYVNGNFQEIYREMEQHRHDGADSPLLADTVPSSGSTYGLGQPLTRWATAYVDTVQFGDGSKMSSASGGGASSSLNSFVDNASKVAISSINFPSSDFTYTTSASSGSLALNRSSVTMMGSSPLYRFSALDQSTAAISASVSSLAVAISTTSTQLISTYTWANSQFISLFASATANAIAVGTNSAAQSAFAGAVNAATPTYGVKADIASSTQTFWVAIGTVAQRVEVIYGNVQSTFTNLQAQINGITAATGTYIDTSGSTQTKTGGQNILGYVGIGTTAPTSLVDIKGGSVSIHGAGAAFGVFNDTSSFVVFGPFAPSFVGIGTSRPSYRLEVSTSINQSSVIASINKSSGSGANGMLLLGNDQWPSVAAQTYLTSSGWAPETAVTKKNSWIFDFNGGTMSFQNRFSGITWATALDGNSVNAAAIDGNQNFGIGTTTITSKLDILNGSITVRGTNAAIGVNGTDIAVAISTTGTMLLSSSNTFAMAIGTTGAMLTSSSNTFAVNIGTTGAMLTSSSNTLSGLLNSSSSTYNTAIATTGAMLLSSSNTFRTSISTTGAMLQSSSNTFIVSIGTTGAMLQSSSNTLSGLLNSSSSTFNMAIATTGAMLLSSSNTIVSLIKASATLDSNLFASAFSSISTLQTASGTLTARANAFDIFKTTAERNFDNLALATAALTSPSTQYIQNTSILINGTSLYVGSGTIQGFIANSIVITTNTIGPTFQVNSATHVVAIKLTPDSNQTDWRIRLAGAGDPGGVPAGMSLYENISDGLATPGTRLMLKSGGNVGIGTTNPATALDIENGALTVSGNVGTGGAIQASGFGSSYFSNGNVGIGTTNPATALDVVGGSIRTAGNLISAAQGGEGGQMILTYPGVVPTGQQNGTWNFDVDSSSSVRIFAQKPDATAPYVLAIKNSNGDFTYTGGNMGLGTTAPSSSFDVASGTSTFRNGFIVGGGTLTVFGGNVGVGTTNPSSKFEVGGGSITVQTGNALLLKTNDQNHGLKYTNGDFVSGDNVDGPVLFGWAGGRLGTVSSGARNVLAWNSAGNVGIGTTSPGAALEVNGSQKIDGSNFLEFGGNVSGKETNAGKIGYQTFTSGALDIVGAGTSSLNRYIKFWNEGGAGFSGNVGIGSLTPTSALDVAGFVNSYGLQTAAISPQRAVYVRGTGLNSSANRLVYVGSYTVVNNTSRGLNLAIFNAPTQALITTTDYDTFGSTTASDSLASALNAMTKTQIGILSSYDAYEAAITTTLYTSSRRLGLFKLGGTPVGSRRAYAAIFYGAPTGVAGRQAIEVLQSNSGSAPYAIVNSWFMSDGFVGNEITNALASGDSAIAEPVVFVDGGGNVGVGTSGPLAALNIGSSNGGSNFSTGANLDFVIGQNHITGGYTALEISRSANTGGYNGIQSIKTSGSAFGDIVLNEKGGNVGIGGTPSYKLDVAGDMRGSPIVRQGGTYTNGSIYSDSNWGMIFRSAQASPTNAEFSFADTSDNKIFTILHSGNVGIGTTGPQKKMELVGQIGLPQSSTMTFGAGGGNYDYLSQIYQDPQNASNFIIKALGDTNYGTPDHRHGAILFETHERLAGFDQPRNALYLGGTGNVGIGTTNPGATVDIFPTNTTGNLFQATPYSTASIAMFTGAALNTETGSNNSNVGGYQFTVGTNSLVLTHLGIYSVAGGANISTYSFKTVGIYDSAGTLLINQIIYATDTAVVDSFVYDPISASTPITLNAGKIYTILQTNPSANPPNYGWYGAQVAIATTPYISNLIKKSQDNVSALAYTTSNDFSTIQQYIAPGMKFSVLAQNPSISISSVGNVGVGSFPPSSKFQVSGATIPSVFSVTTDGLILSSGPAVVLTGCGTGATTSPGSNISWGAFTVGTLPGTCVVSWSPAYPNNASCMIQNDTIGASAVIPVSQTTSSFTVNGTIALNNVIHWRCDGN